MLNFKTTEDRKSWVSSDFHLGHNKEFVYGARGFTTSKEHTDAVINSVNECVRPNDNLFYLGDFSLNTTESEFEEYISRILCQNIFMLWGNHNNPVNKIYEREVARIFNPSEELRIENQKFQIYPLRYRNIIFMGDYIEAKIDHRLVTMFHYPIHVFNHMKEGGFMLCGHSHYGLPFSKRENMTSKILDVGWDGHRRPYEFGEIIEIMNKKTVFLSGDHHIN